MKKIEPVRKQKCELSYSKLPVLSLMMSIRYVQYVRTSTVWEKRKIFCPTVVYVSMVQYFILCFAASLRSYRTVAWTERERE